ncbi:MAG: discoidin domain-containing protein [Verrucomicrobiia bacterium]
MNTDAHHALVAALACFALNQVTLAQETPAGMEKLDYRMPKPMFISTQKNFGNCNLEPSRGDKPRPPIFVPQGCSNLALKKEVTSSGLNPDIGSLDLITDGDKEEGDHQYAELSPGLQWVQIDLGRSCEIRAIVVWHRHYDPRVYRDVIVQIADDAKFIDGVKIVFNNDHDNSSGLGIGKDLEYIENYEGRPIAVKGVKGRYVRLYSSGNTSNQMNHYMEVEVYGK